METMYLEEDTTPPGQKKRAFGPRKASKFQSGFGVIDASMNRTPRDNQLISKWQGNDNFKLCNYILGGVRVSSAKDQHEPPNIQSYQIDIKMGEATITE